MCFKKTPNTQTKKVFQRTIICFWWLKDIISLLYSELNQHSLSFLSAIFWGVLPLLMRVHVLSFSQQQIFAGGCNIWNSLRQYSFPSPTRQIYGMWFNWYLFNYCLLTQSSSFLYVSLQLFPGSVCEAQHCRRSEQKVRAAV